MNSNTRQTVLLVIIALLVGLGWTASQLLLSSQQDLQRSREQVVILKTQQQELQQVVAISDTKPILAKAVALLPHDGQIVFTARASDVAVLIVMTKGLESDDPYEYWFVDTGSGKASLVTSRKFGPAPSFSYRPYDLGYKQPVLHVEVQDGWEGPPITYIDNIDPLTGTVIATVSTQTSPGSVTVERDGKRVTLEYLYTGACSVQKDSGKFVDVVGVKVNGSREMRFAKARKASCAWSDMSGEATVASYFGGVDLSVDGGGPFANVEIRLMGEGNGSIVIPFDGFGDPSKVRMVE